MLNPRMLIPRMLNSPPGEGEPDEFDLRAEVYTPDLFNPRLFRATKNTSFTDFVWKIHNEGNSSSGFLVGILSVLEEVSNCGQGGESICLPDDSQLILYQTYKTPIPGCDREEHVCELTEDAIHYQILGNVCLGPRFNLESTAGIIEFDAFHWHRKVRFSCLLRMFDDNARDSAPPVNPKLISAVIVPQAPNTKESPTVTTLIVDRTRVSLGGPVVFTAKVISTAGEPAGIVTFLARPLNRNIEIPLGTRPIVQGEAVLTLCSGSGLPPASYTVVALYRPSPAAEFVCGTPTSRTDNPCDSQPIDIVVERATVTDLQIDADPGNPEADKNVELIVTLIENIPNIDPTGTVTYFDGPHVIGSAEFPPTGGVVSIIIPASVLGAGEHSISASYSGDENFAPTTSSSAGSQLILTISKGSQTISPGPIPSGLAYSTSPLTSFSLSSTASSGLPVSYSLVSGPASVSPTTGAGTVSGAGTVVIEVTQAGNPSYESAPAQQVSFDVMKAAQTISPGPMPSGLYYSPNPLTTFLLSSTASSGLPVSYGLVSGPATVNPTTGAGTVSGAGTVIIELTQAGNPSFDSAPAHQISFDVLKAAQTIEFQPIGNQSFGESPFALIATSNSGLPIDFSVISGGSFVSVSNGVLTILGASGGQIVKIKASQPGDINYLPADSDRSFQILETTATLTVSDLNQVFDGSPKSVGVSSVPANLNGIIVTYNGVSTPPVNSGDYQVVASLNTDNYAADDVIVTLIVQRASAGIHFGNLNQIYDGSPKSVTVAAVPSGLAVSPVIYTGVTVNYGPSPDPPVNAGRYNAAVVIEDRNYAGEGSAQLEIGKAEQTISFDPVLQEISVGDTIELDAISTSGLPVSLSLISGNADLVQQPGGGTWSLTPSDDGTLIIRASQSGNDNYGPAPEVERTFEALPTSEFEFFGFFYPLGPPVIKIGNSVAWGPFNNWGETVFGPFDNDEGEEIPVRWVIFKDRPRTIAIPGCGGRSSDRSNESM